MKTSPLFLATLFLLNMASLTSFSAVVDKIETKNAQGETIATFERVEAKNFSAAWKVNGTIWTDAIEGVYPNAPDASGKKKIASEACAEKGGRLPTLAEYQSLQKDFDLLQTNGSAPVFYMSIRGLFDLFRLFPNLNQGYLWLSNSNDRFINFFNAKDGSFYANKNDPADDYYAIDDTSLQHVQCILPNSVEKPN